MTGAAPAPINLHATALVYDGVGVLITGASGAGKSLLALDLLDHAALAGRPAHLVADDQVLIEADGGALLAAAPPTTAGLIELRGRGIVARSHRTPATIHLLLDLVEGLDRLPPAAAFVTELAGIRLARAPIPSAGAADPLHRRLLALEAIELCRAGAEKTT